MRPFSRKLLRPISIALAASIICSCDGEKKDDRVNMEDKAPPAPPKKEFKPISESPIPPPPPPPKEKVVFAATPASLPRRLETPGKTILLVIESQDCQHCRGFSPLVDSYAEDLAGKLLVLHLDADQYPELARQYSTEVVPRVIIFQEGQQVRDFNGSCSRSKLEQIVAPYLPK